MTKSPKKKRNRLSPEELQRRRAQRRASMRESVQRLLYSREQTAEVLGGISISSVIRLERDGRLAKVRLRGAVFHRCEDVHALASQVEAA
jgi:hypothetical protein